MVSPVSPDGAVAHECVMSPALTSVVRALLYGMGRWQAQTQELFACRLLSRERGVNSAVRSAVIQQAHGRRGEVFRQHALLSRGQGLARSISLKLTMALRFSLYRIKT